MTKVNVPERDAEVFVSLTEIDRALLAVTNRAEDPKVKALLEDARDCVFDAVAAQKDRIGTKATEYLSAKRSEAIQQTVQQSPDLQQELKAQAEHAKQQQAREVAAKQAPAPQPQQQQ